MSILLSVIFFAWNNEKRRKISFLLPKYMGTLKTWPRPLAGPMAYIWPTYWPTCWPTSNFRSWFRKSRLQILHVYKSFKRFVLMFHRCRTTRMMRAREVRFIKWQYNLHWMALQTLSKQNSSENVILHIMSISQNLDHYFKAGIVITYN